MGRAVILCMGFPKPGHERGLIESGLQVKKIPGQTSPQSPRQSWPQLSFLSQGLSQPVHLHPTSGQLSLHLWWLQGFCSATFFARAFPLPFGISFDAINSLSIWLNISAH